MEHLNIVTLNTVGIVPLVAQMFAEQIYDPRTNAAPARTAQSWRVFFKEQPFPGEIRWAEQVEHFR